MPAEASRKALSFVLITVFIDTVGFGIIAPVIPELIMELTGEGLSQAARYGGWLLFVYALMQFFFAPIMGNLGDRFGRRPVLLLSLLAFGIDFLVMGMAPNLAWLFVGRLVAGIAGATTTTANAYVADVTPPEQRAQNFGMIGAAWGVGFIVGPVLGGFLGEFGARLPFFAAAGLALANFTFGFFVLPESLAREDRRPFSLLRANPVGALVQLRQFPVVIGLVGALLLYQLAHDTNPSVWSYYTMEKFGWSERDVGLSLGAVGVMTVLVWGLLTRLVIPWLGEPRSVYFGLLLSALGFAGFGLATQGWQMYLFIAVFSLGSIAIPALRAIMANQVPANAQGELQGAITSAISLTAVVAPLLMTQLFGYFTAETAPIYFPGAPFVTAAVLVLAAWSICLMRIPASASAQSETN